MAKERWRGRGLDADRESRGTWVSSPARLRHVKLRKAWPVLEPQLSLEKTPHTHCSGLEGTLWRLRVSGVKSCGSSGEEEPRDASPWDHEVCTLPSFLPGLLPGLGEEKHVVSDPQGHPWAGPLTAQVLISASGLAAWWDLVSA